jgi:hypothetical protein
LSEADFPSKRAAPAAALLFVLSCTAAAAQDTGPREFGVWLDDATISPRGRGWGTVGVGHYRSALGRQSDLPSFDAGFGLGHRVQVALSVPLARLRYTDGSRTRGLGDVYFATKVGLVDPEKTGTYGVALAPLLEVLGTASVFEGQGRVHWALPLTVERRFTGFRAYGSAGYFSRGAAFGAAALEVPLSDDVTGTFALTHTRSLSSDPLGDALLLARSRSDASLGATYFLSPSATVYASVGRTVSHLDQNGSSLALSAGVSFGFQHRFRRRGSQGGP